MPDEGCQACYGGDCRACGRGLTWSGMHWRHHSAEHHEAWRHYLLKVIARQLNSELNWRMLCLFQAGVKGTGIPHELKPRGLWVRLPSSALAVLAGLASSLPEFPSG